LNTPNQETPKWLDLMRTLIFQMVKQGGLHILKCLKKIKFY